MDIGDVEYKNNFHVNLISSVWKNGRLNVELECNPVSGFEGINIVIKNLVIGKQI